jgi:hypothetical protein
MENKGLKLERKRKKRIKTKIENEKREIERRREIKNTDINIQ